MRNAFARWVFIGSPVALAVVVGEIASLQRPWTFIVGGIAGLISSAIYWETY